MPKIAREPDNSDWWVSLGGYSNWQRWTGINCYGGRGGLAMPEFDPASPPDAPTNLQECMDLCAGTDGCDGVQTQDPFTACWLRSEVDVQDCWDDAPTVMYTKPSGVFRTFVVKQFDSPAHVTISIAEILLFIGVVALAVYLLWKKKLLCFKPKIKLTEEEAQSFKEMDIDGDGIITEAEFHKYRQERQCGRSCNTCWGGDDKEDKKEGGSTWWPGQDSKKEGAPRAC